MIVLNTSVSDTPRDSFLEPQNRQHPIPNVLSNITDALKPQMQIGKETSVRLLLIDDNGNDAEAIVSALRNKGIAIHPSRPLDAEQLKDQLEKQSIDLILAAERAKHIPVSEVLAQVIESGKDIPVVVLLEDLKGVKDTAVIEGMINGAIDDIINGASAIVLRNRTDHLISVLNTELEDLKTRRSFRLLEAQIRETERRCDALIESSRDPIAYVHEGMHIRANDAYLEMFGFESFDEVEGLSLLDLIAPQNVEDFRKLLKRISKGEQPPEKYECEAHTQAGEDFPAVMEFATATYDGEPCIQVIFRRREQNTELSREIEDLRQRDVVTGLLNRPTFMRTLEKTVSDVAHGGTQYGFLLLEPDHYARLLFDIGLGSADNVIAAMARQINETLGGDAVSARFGDHRFAVLCKGPYKKTEELANKLRDKFSSHVFAVGERSTTTTLSIGGTQIGEKIASVNQVLEHANETLREASKLGGNRVQIFDPNVTERAAEESKLRILNLIKQALDGGENFVLHYQPIIPLLGAPGDFYEVFLRLKAGGEEKIEPSVFMSIAEEAGLSADIDRLVIARSIALLGEREKRGIPTRLLVKMSEASFASPGNLLLLIGRLLMANNVPTQRLWLELPETKVSSHLLGAQDFLVGAKKLGCLVGLEQFGSGLNPFQLLTHFSPNFLKLDRSLNQDHASTLENHEKIKEIVTYAQENGITTIAEHVHDPATMAQLFSVGLDYIEGYFIAPPAPEMDFDFNV